MDFLLLPKLSSVLLTCLDNIFNRHTLKTQCMLSCALFLFTKKARQSLQIYIKFIQLKIMVSTFSILNSLLYNFYLNYRSTKTLCYTNN